MALVHLLTGGVIVCFGVINTYSELPCSLCGIRWCQKRLKIDCMVCKVAEDEETVEHRAQPDASTAVDHINSKCKAIPLQAWTGPEGSRLRFPDFKTIGTCRR